MNLNTYHLSVDLNIHLHISNFSGKVVECKTNIVIDLYKTVITIKLTI